MMYNLSEKAIAEKYEDLLFTKVMALYAAEESEKILSEIKDEENADLKKIEKIYSKTERRENLSVFWKISKKLITVAAMVVFVAVVSLSSVVIASAEAREAVAEAIYHLMIKEYDRYTEVSIGNSTGFIDPEIYDWEGAYAPTYIPEGFSISDTQFTNNDKSVMYSHGEDYFYISQTNNLSYARIDTEGSEHVEKIIIGNSEAFLVYENEIVSLVWICGETYLSIDGKISIDETIKIAEGIKPLGKTEEPTEEYKFVDPEIYDWEGAYAPTYIPEGFVIEELHLQDGFNAVVYCKDDYFIVIDQMNNSTNMQLDTENAEVTENIRLHNSDGFLVVNENLTTVIWSEGETIFEVSGNIATDEIIKIAESLKPVRNTEKLIPTSEYKFVDPENYNFEGAYAPTYIPEGFVLLQKQRFGSQYCVDYKREGGYISFLQAGKDVIFQVDTEGANTVEKILIGESEGLLVSENGNTYLNWSIGNTNFQIYGTCETDEIIKMAKGIKPLGKTEPEEPAEEYEFIDAEVFNWEGAFAPTYIPEGYIFDEKQELTTRAIITYSNGNSYFTITQSNKTASLHMDTEDADSISEVMINNSQGILVEKDGFSSLAWNVDENFFWVRGEIESAELTKVAEGLKPMN